MVNLHLGGHLAFYAPQKQSRISLPIIHPTGLGELLKKLEIPTIEVAIAAINGELVDLETAEVKPGDLIELYPPMGGG